MFQTTNHIYIYIYESFVSTPYPPSTIESVDIYIYIMIYLAPSCINLKSPFFVKSSCLGPGHHLAAPGLDVKAQATGTETSLEGGLRAGTSDAGLRRLGEVLEVHRVVLTVHVQNAWRWSGERIDGDRW